MMMMTRRSSINHNASSSSAMVMLQEAEESEEGEEEEKETASLFVNPMLPLFAQHERQEGRQQRLPQLKQQQQIVPKHHFGSPEPVQEKKQQQHGYSLSPAAHSEESESGGTQQDKTMHAKLAAPSFTGEKKLLESSNAVRNDVVTTALASYALIAHHETDCLAANATTVADAPSIGAPLEPTTSTASSLVTNSTTTTAVTTTMKQSSSARKYKHDNDWPELTAISEDQDECEEDERFVDGDSSSLDQNERCVIGTEKKSLVGKHMCDKKSTSFPKWVTASIVAIIAVTFFFAAFSNGSHQTIVDTMDVIGQCQNQEFPNRAAHDTNSQLLDDRNALGRAVIVERKFVCDHRHGTAGRAVLYH
jgi:hypothetical protein